MNHACMAVLCKIEQACRSAQCLQQEIALRPNYLTKVENILIFSFRLRSVRPNLAGLIV